MALTAQLLETWKPRAEAYTDKKAVFVQALCNRNYEGEAKENATVHILTVGDVSVSTYSGGWNDSDFASLSTTKVDFSVDQKDKILFRVNDTDQLGSAIKLLDNGMERAAVAIALEVDAFIAGKHSEITTNVYGSDASPIVVGFDSGSGEVLPSRALSRLQRKLAESNADQDAPNVVVPAWLADALLVELGVNRATALGDQLSRLGVTTGLLQGVTAGGFSQIYVSNNVVNTASAKYKVMAGTPKSAITFASAIDKLESGRIQNDFADFVKGLYVYGAKVPFETHMALGTFDAGHYPDLSTII